MARVLFFGKLADLAGDRSREITMSAGVQTIGQLIDQIAAEDSFLGAALREKSIRYIVNEQIGSGEGVTDKDEIAFLPPVSGG